MAFPDVIAFIEIPYGSIHKYEYDFTRGKIIITRTIAPLKYPYSYGFIPNTLCPDGDPLDIIILGDTILKSGEKIPVTVIGILELSDSGGYDPKIVAYPLQQTGALPEITPEVCSIIEQFIIQAKAQKNEQVVFHEWSDKTRAYEIIKKFTNY